MDITYLNYEYDYFDLWISIIQINDSHKCDDLMISIWISISNYCYPFINTDITNSYSGYH